MSLSTNNALNLLSAYDSSSDGSEEEIPGPKVSVKRPLPNCAESGNCFQNKKLATNDIRRLPPPTALLELFKDDIPDQVKDSEADHSGRVRSFPHERGNWASYVYISVDASSSIESFIDLVCTTCDPSLNLQRSNDLHISVTKTVILKHHWIDSISSSIQDIACSVKRFPICLGDIRVYTNEEQTRTFIGIVVTAGKENLTKLVARLDQVLSDFRLPPFYEEASFHLSIASCVGNHINSLKSHLPKLQTSLEMFIHGHPLEWGINVEALHFRTGNKYFSFKLMY
ncbi:U6 snRNA phosphodiesterase [Thrips palmi]|uniref:U6 snRNA phosphodiesterase n=1 Tax=Thrips palmi TaxID=161013 RepID=A0A6P9A021_THRPL|nr:U6 snRNA phosphodiesterase [Thrips palmi]